MYIVIKSANVNSKYVYNKIVAFLNPSAQNKKHDSFLCIIGSLEASITVILSACILYILFAISLMLQFHLINTNIHQRS